MDLEIFDVGKIAGIPTNTWTSLYGAANRIGLFSNENTYIDPFTQQFYFDIDNGLLYTRFTDGAKTELNDKETLDENHVEVDIGNNKYKMRLLPGGMADSEVGRFHDVYGMENIVGLFK